MAPNTERVSRGKDSTSGERNRTATHAGREWEMYEGVGSALALARAPIDGSDGKCDTGRRDGESTNVGNDVESRTICTKENPNGRVAAEVG